MTVQQLIALLATYPPDLRVVVNGYEDGFDNVEPERVSVTRIELDVGEHWWDGRHAAAADRAADEHVGVSWMRSRSGAPRAAARSVAWSGCWFAVSTRKAMSSRQRHSIRRLERSPSQ